VLPPLLLSLCSLFYTAASAACRCSAQLNNKSCFCFVFSGQYQSHKPNILLPAQTHSLAAPGSCSSCIK
jgi:hypothetical protein